MKGIIFLCVMVAAFFLAVEVYTILHRALMEYRRRYVGARVEELGNMFIFIDPSQLLLLNFSVMGLCLGVGLIFMGTISTVMLTAFGFFLPLLAVRYYREKRIEKFEMQLVDALNAMANAFKAGLTLPQAMDQIATQGMPPISQEFRLVVNEVKIGVPMDEALSNMSRRIDSDDLKLLVVSTNIARSLGGNMAEMFETIASTIRERFRLEGKIKSMTSQGKMQGWIVALLPLAMGLILNYMRPDLMEPMLEHWFGWALIGCVIIMEALGIFFIRRIVNINV